MKKIFFLSGLLFFASLVNGQQVLTGKAIIIRGTIGTGSDVGSYSQSQMFYNTKKGAFRAGRSVDWTNAQVGDYSGSGGLTTIASGLYSFSWGGSAIASGTASGAIGLNSRSSGFGSFSWGNTCIASGNQATAGGIQSVASGDNSLAIGDSAFSYGLASVALNKGTNTKAWAGTVLGSYNDTSGSANSIQWNAANRVFQIGIGTSHTARANALTVLQNGNVGLGVLSPTRQLEVINDAAIGLNATYTTSGLLGTVAGDGVAYIGDYDEVNNGVKIKVDDGAGEITMNATDHYINGRLNQQGQVSIGRSATYGLGVIYVEHAVGGARVYMGDFDGNNNSTNIYLNDVDGEITMYSNLGYIMGGGPVRMASYGAGTATFDASGNISSVSDIRLKNVSTTYTAGLSHLKKIKPIVFKWNELSGMEMQHDYIGFSAQNINETLGDGATGINNDGYLSIQDRAIMAVMVNSINELSAKVEKLEKEVKRLKRK